MTSIVPAQVARHGGWVWRKVSQRLRSCGHSAREHRPALVNSNSSLISGKSVDRIAATKAPRVWRPLEIRDANVLVDGRRIETRLIRPRKAKEPVVVMLHGGLGSIQDWGDFPEAFAERTGHCVLVYSRYGHGQSERLNSPRIATYMHREGTVVLPELLEVFSIRRPVLLGHSDGGSIALIYAGEHPQSCAGLLLESPHVFVEEVSLDSIARMRARFGADPVLEQKLVHHHSNPRELFFGWADIWLHPEFRDWSIENFLQDVVCPAMLIQGGQDDYGTPLQLDRIATHAKGRVETHFLPDCGHSPHRIHPEQVLLLANRFLSDLD